MFPHDIIPNQDENPRGTALERGGNTLNGFDGFRTGNGSSQGRNLAVTVLFVPNSLDSGSLIRSRALLGPKIHMILAYGRRS